MATKRKNRCHPDYEEVRVTSLIAPVDDWEGKGENFLLGVDNHTLCVTSEHRSKEDYNESKNFLYVMEAFSHRVDKFSEGGKLSPADVTVPYWMAEAIASGFRLYLTNLNDGCRQNLTLDWCYNITAEKKNNYDCFTITAEKVLTDAYELQWLFGISREQAIEIAYTVIERRYEGEANFACIVDSIIDMAKRTSINNLPSFKEWQKQSDCTGVAPKIMQDDYMALLKTYDSPYDDSGVSLSEKLKAALPKYRKV
ncbi:MAG: hypothetical protein PHI31_06780 [Desulfuromonadaceae bacterium]|nr:hypothetical protein [Desulfuromonadaceae bacterium]